VGLCAHFFFGKDGMAEKVNIEQRTWEVAGPIIAGEGYELIEVEYLREPHGWVLRLFVDRQTGGIGLEDCQKCSRAVETALDVEDFIPNEYNLEVSSPGLSRPLRKPQHFERVIGQIIKVKTYGPLFDPPRKNFTGTLSSVTPNDITVQVEGAGPFTIAFKDIAKANLEYHIQAAQPAEEKRNRP
jgi:ribosome maturation factor RimP